MNKLGLASAAAVVTLAGCMTGDTIEQGVGKVGESAADEGLLGSAVTKDLFLDYGAWIGTYEGGSPGVFNIVMTMQNVSIGDRDEDLLRDQTKVYWNQCAYASEFPGSELLAGCRQSAVESPWWSPDVPEGAFEWRPTLGHDDVPTPYHSILMRADMPASQPQIASLQPINLLVQPLTAELVVDNRDKPGMNGESRYYRCSITAFLEAFERLRFVGDKSGESFDADLHVWGGAGIANFMLAPPRADEAEDTSFASVRRVVDEREPASTSVDVAVDWTSEVTVEVSGFGSKPLSLGGCDAGCIAGTQLGWQDLFSLFDGAVDDSIEVRIQTAEGESYRASVNPTVVPYDAQMSCDLYAMPASCVVAEDGVLCEGGVDAQGHAVDPAETYCGRWLCGADQTYVCTDKGWEATGFPCDPVL
jgi:hypothetical protein